MTERQRPLRHRRSRSRRSLRYAILFLVAGLVLIPLVATALGGFKSLGDLRVNPFGLPAQWEWRNYWDDPVRRRATGS